MKDLIEIREEIDDIDSRIIRLYEKRMELTTGVAEYKISTGKQVLDKERELEKLKRAEELVVDEKNRYGVRELFEQIMAMSRKRQYQLMVSAGLGEKTDFQLVDRLPFEKGKVVYQGVEGAYSQIAMQEYFGKNVESFHVDTWRDAMEAIKNVEADYAVLPIENSSAGIVSENYDLLVEYNHYIAAEQTIKVESALLGVPGAEISDITCVYSHPQSFLQSVDFLNEHKDWEQIRLVNNAVSAKKVSEEGKKNQAAIASSINAELYGLKILKERVNYSAENSTRFIIVTGKKVYTKDAGKISICFEIPHESGSLYRMLSHFIFNNINMVKIESRPIKDKSFEYRFFVEFEGKLTDGAVQNALKGLKEEASAVKILGNY